MLSIKELINKTINMMSKSYNFYKWPAGTISVSSSSSPTCTLNITTHGRPVYINYTGDFNPVDTGAWCRIRLYRDDILLCQQIIQSGTNSWNIPIMLDYLDIISKGTYIYKAIVTIGSGTGVLGEDNASTGKETPQFIIFEI